MAFTLKQTRQFQHDIGDLRSRLEIHPQLEQVLQWLEDDPARHQASLQSHRLARAVGEKIWKSRVNANYRILWSYGTDSDIILARVGEHDFIDYVAGVTDLRVAAMVNRPARATPAVVPLLAQRPPESLPAGLFGRIHPNVLRILGVPADRIADVQALRDPNRLYDIGLPSHAADTLMDLYTRDDCNLETLLLDDRVLYRASADQLSGYFRGELKQLLLDLAPDQQKYVSLRANGPVLIKGVAGSGKTTVGLRKAMEERRRLGLFGDQLEVMFTTFTETLATSVRQMFVEQYGPDRAHDVQVSVLRDWLRSHAGDVVVGNAGQLTTCLATAISRVKPATADSGVWRISDFQSFLKEEIENVIKGRNLPDLDAYAKARRTGRERGLQLSARKIIWQVYEAYQAALRARGIVDYVDIAILALDRLGAPPPEQCFDVVIVDEAQDLRPVELFAIRKLCRGRDGSGLILLGDAAQTLYYRGISWLDAGIDIRGRAYELKRNFRNTRQILEAAWKLIEAGGEGRRALGGELIPPERTNKTGPLPTIILRPTLTDQRRAIEEEIVRLCETARVRPGDIAVLGPTKERLYQIRGHLAQARIPCVHFRDDDFEVFENKVKLITIHSAKGLEFPVVFVLGLTEGELPRSAQEALAEDGGPGTLDDRQLLYVAMTRAAHRLYLVGDTARPSRFLADMGLGL